MSQRRQSPRNRTTPPAGSTARSRQRGKPVQVQAKTPWGFIAGSTVVGLALLGVVGYAVFHQGAGFVEPVAKADKSFGSALVKADAATLTRNHVTTRVTYPGTPPMGGDHNPVWEDCAVYTQQVPDENAVHSLEHGAVWITYQPGLAAGQVATLSKLVDGQPYALLSPYPGQKSPVELTAWGRQLAVPSASDGRVRRFLDAYENGPQTPEKGALCSGGTSNTGTVPQGVDPTAPAVSSTSAAQPGVPQSTTSGTPSSGATSPAP